MDKQAKRIREGNRTQLENVIPLDTPFHLFVDPSAACNFKCNYCFHSERPVSTKIMELEVFEKIINDVKAFPKRLKVLRLYKEGEPLLNKNFESMVAYARAADVAEFIDFTTNGVYLTQDRSLKIIQAGVNAINISIPSIDEEMITQITGKKVDFDTYRRQLKFLYDHRGDCRIHIKTTDVGLHGEDKSRYFNLFSELCDELSIEQIVPIWPDKDISNVKTDFQMGLYNQPLQDIQVCPYIFYSMSINADGSVSSCFLDWQHRNIIGDVREQSVLDIWNGKKMHDLRVLHLMMRRSENSVCGTCNQLKYATADDIDAFAGNILERLRR